MSKAVSEAVSKLARSEIRLAVDINCQIDGSCDNNNTSPCWHFPSTTTLHHVGTFPHTNNAYITLCLASHSLCLHLSTTHSVTLSH